MAYLLVRSRLQQSCELLLEAGYTPAARRDAVLPGIFLPANKSGLGIADPTSARATPRTPPSSCLRSWAPRSAVERVRELRERDQGLGRQPRAGFDRGDSWFQWQSHGGRDDGAAGGAQAQRG